MSPILSPSEQPPTPIQSPPEQPPKVARALPSCGHPALASNALIDIAGDSQLAAQVNPANEGMDVDQDSQQVDGGIPTGGAKPGRGQNRGVRPKARASDGRGVARGQMKRKRVDIQGEEQSAKRQRKGGSAKVVAASSSYPAMAIIPPLANWSSLSSCLPDNTPTWVPITLKFLQSKVPSKVPGEDWTALGDKWSDAVSTWLSLEIRAGFAASTKLGMLKRPSCISNWIQQAHIPTYHPIILDLHKFESDFLAWWASLQPKWRHGSKLLRMGGNDWEPLRRTGVNGLLSVLAALFFWQYVIGKGETGAWERSLDDMVWALQGLTHLRMWHRNVFIQCLLTATISCLLTHLSFFPWREAVVFHDINDHLKHVTYTYHPPPPMIGNASTKCTPPLHKQISPSPTLCHEHLPLPEHIPIPCDKRCMQEEVQSEHIPTTMGESRQQ